MYPQENILGGNSFAGLESIPAILLKRIPPQRLSGMSSARDLFLIFWKTFWEVSLLFLSYGRL